MANGSKPAGKLIPVTLNEEQVRILEGMKEFGNTNAERLRNIFITFHYTQKTPEAVLKAMQKLVEEDRYP